MKAKPSLKLRAFLRAYGNLNSAAVAWNVDYKTLERFFREGAGLSLVNAFKISRAVGLPVEDLFEPRGSLEKESKS